jgi:hypothetical protein
MELTHGGANMTEVSKSEVHKSEVNKNDWRQLCSALAIETDSSKLGSLVEALISALEEDEQPSRCRMNAHRTPSHELNPAPSIARSGAL